MSVTKIRAALDDVHDAEKRLEKLLKGCVVGHRVTLNKATNSIGGRVIDASGDRVRFESDSGKVYWVYAFWITSVSPEPRP